MMHGRKNIKIRVHVSYKTYQCSYTRNFTESLDPNIHKFSADYQKTCVYNP